jgi:hypothetical protein
MTAWSPSLRKIVPPALTVISVIVAARLLFPAAVFAFLQTAADEFNATGLPRWMRLTLALPEILGAVLFVIPRTLPLGALVLLIDLVAAIAVHLSLGMQPTSLYLLLAAVLLLAIARRRLLT